MSIVATPGDGRVTLHWTAPNNGGALITHYEFRQRTGTGAWGAWMSTGSNATSFTRTGLANGTSFGFQVRAVNGAGNAGVSNIASATPVGAVLQRRLTGIQVIECFSRIGYLDVFSSLTTTAVESSGGNRARRPIWVFVNITGNVYAIRNETTGRYLTETSRNLRHEARIGATYDNRQRWELIEQNDGSFKIRSFSQPTLYITHNINHYQSIYPTLSTNSTFSNFQRWWIGHIWHSDANVIAFWNGTISVYTYEFPRSPTNFTTRMGEARADWSSALGVTFNTVNNRYNANIRVYGGDRILIQEHLRHAQPFTGAGIFIPPQEEYAIEIFDTIHAGGSNRTVARFAGRGTSANIIAVFPETNENLIRMITIHELGHALGYYGHSPNSNDVMYRETPFFGGPNTQLNPAEIEHLRQIYRIFR